MFSRAGLLLFTLVQLFGSSAFADSFRVHTLDCGGQPAETICDRTSQGCGCNAWVVQWRRPQQGLGFGISRLGGGVCGSLSKTTYDAAIKERDSTIDFEHRYARFFNLPFDECFSDPTDALCDVCNSHAGTGAAGIPADWMDIRSRYLRYVELGGGRNYVEPAKQGLSSLRTHLKNTYLHSQGLPDLVNAQQAFQSLPQPIQNEILSTDPGATSLGGLGAWANHQTNPPGQQNDSWFEQPQPDLLILREVLPNIRQELQTHRLEIPLAQVDRARLRIQPDHNQWSLEIDSKDREHGGIRYYEVDGANQGFYMIGAFAYFPTRALAEAAMQQISALASQF